MTSKVVNEKDTPVGFHLKRSLILDAARRVFENDGLEGASLRAIAAEAGYTPAALYFHFDSKEAIYAELLASSLAALRDAVDAADGVTVKVGHGAETRSVPAGEHSAVVCGEREI